MWSKLKYAFKIVIICHLQTCSGISGAISQQIFSLRVGWTDSFREWEVEYILDTEAESTSIGRLATAWSTIDSWDEWLFELGDFRGTIRQKLKSNPVTWELNSGFSILSARTTWPNNTSEWRINTELGDYTLRSKWENIGDEWELFYQNQKYAVIYTSVIGDPRWWIFEPFHELLPPLDVQLMACFLVSFATTPQR